MKTSIATFAIAALALLAAAPTAEARHKNRVYVSGYKSCGTPVYHERYFIGYDRCGNPIWGTRVVRHYSRPVFVDPPCRPAYRPPVYHCPPTYHHSRPYSGTSIVFHGSFGR